MAGSTPIYGFPYPQSTDLVADYPTLGQELAEDVETVISGLGSGLNLISPTSIANSGGSATRSGGQVTFSSVSSVSVNGVFSATYENYLLKVILTGASGISDIYFRMRSAGTDNSSGNYTRSKFYWGTANQTGSDSGSSTATSFIFAEAETSAAVQITTQLANPFATQQTRHSTQCDKETNGLIYSGALKVTTSYDGLTILPGSAVTFSGSIRVYGYKNS